MNCVTKKFQKICDKNKTISMMQKIRLQKNLSKLLKNQK